MRRARGSGKLQAGRAWTRTGRFGGGQGIDAGSSSTGSTTGSRRCSSCTWAVRSGGTRTAAAWSVPKGEYGPGEDPLEVARREFTEELGQSPPPGECQLLGEIRQAGGKVVTVWTLQADFDTADVSSNTFSMEWPRGSGRMQDFPEVDRADWHDFEAAREKLVAGQVALIDLLAAKVRKDPE